MDIEPSRHGSARERVTKDSMMMGLRGMSEVECRVCDCVRVSECASAGVNEQTLGKHKRATFT
jgi:hypothetical protein